MSVTYPAYFKITLFRTFFFIKTVAWEAVNRVCQLAFLIETRFSTCAATVKGSRIERKRNILVHQFDRILDE
jgi:hypothetical protein